MGILSFIVIYGRAGSVGVTLSPILGGCLGGIKYVIPFGICATAFAVARDGGSYIKSKIFQVVLLMGFVASVLSIYQISIGNIDKSNGFETVIQAGYTLGVSNKGGGTIGAAISYPLVMLFSEFGASVVSLGATVFLVVFTFGLRPSGILEGLSDRLEESRQIRREEEEERQIRRKERKLNSKVIDIPIEEDEDVQREINKKRKRARINNSIEEENLNSQPDIEDEQIKINLNSESEQSNKGIIKGILRKQDKSAEIVDFSEANQEQQNPNELKDLIREQEIVKENKTQAILQLEHNTTSEDDENYEVPPLELMKEGSPKANKGGKKALTDTALKLQKTLYSFGVSAKVENVSVGPAITRYELKPAERC